MSLPLGSPKNLVPTNITTYGRKIIGLSCGGLISEHTAMMDNDIDSNIKNHMFFNYNGPGREWDTSTVSRPSWGYPDLGARPHTMSPARADKLLEEPSSLSAQPTASRQAAATHNDGQGYKLVRRFNWQDLIPREDMCDADTEQSRCLPLPELQSYIFDMLREKVSKETRDFVNPFRSNSNILPAYQRPPASKPKDDQTERQAAGFGHQHGVLYSFDISKSVASRPWFEHESFKPAGKAGADEFDLHFTEALPKRSGVRRLEVPGKLKGKTVTAMPDFGSGFNIVSEDIAVQNKWKINTSDAACFSLPNGTTKDFLGTVTLPWSFGNETRKHSCIFHVLKGCVHPVLLGRQFLHLTGTLKHNVRRVKETVVDAISLARKRLLLVDELNEQMGTSSHIQGLVNGQSITGLADTGSDLTVIKRSAANRMGLQIFEGDAYTTEVEFVDGSTAFTTGMVRDAKWCFGADASKAQSIKIYVMDDIPCDLILDKWLLWDAQAFREHQNLFVHPGSSGPPRNYDVCMITEKHRFLQAFRDKIRDATIRDIFRSVIGRSGIQSQGDPITLQVRTVHGVLHDEAVAGGAAKDRIATLNGADREHAQHEEDERVRRWKIAQHDLDRANAPNINPVVTTVAQAGLVRGLSVL